MAIELDPAIEQKARELLRALPDSYAPELLSELAAVATDHLRHCSELPQQAAAALIYIEELETELEAWKSSRL